VLIERLGPEVAGPAGRVTLERIDPATLGTGTASLRLVAPEVPPAPGDGTSASALGGRGPGTASLRALPRPPTLADSAAVPPMAPSSPTTHVVIAGDHLWSIAEARLAIHLGRTPSDAEIAPYWRVVVAANPQLDDPDLVFPGDTITVPALAPAPPPEPLPKPTDSTGKATLRLTSD
jgi:nucleoid-associated protein YgaU